MQMMEVRQDVLAEVKNVTLKNIQLQRQVQLLERERREATSQTIQTVQYTQSTQNTSNNQMQNMDSSLNELSQTNTAQQFQILMLEKQKQELEKRNQELMKRNQELQIQNKNKASVSSSQRQYFQGLQKALDEMEIQNSLLHQKYERLKVIPDLRQESRKQKGHLEALTKEVQDLKAKNQTLMHKPNEAPKTNRNDNQSPDFFLQKKYAQLETLALQRTDQYESQIIKLRSTIETNNQFSESARQLKMSLDTSIKSLLQARDNYNSKEMCTQLLRKIEELNSTLKNLMRS